MNEVALDQYSPLSFNFSPTPGLASAPAAQSGVGVCFRCGKPLVGKRKDAKWCSISCRNLNSYYSRERSARMLAATERLNKKCRACGCDFRAKHANEKECSYRCYLDFRIISRGNAVPPKIEYCINCGGKIPENKMAGTKYCSRTCASRAQAKKQSKNPTLSQKIRRAMSHRMRQAIKHSGSRKHKSTFSLLGCDSEFAKKWIESKFLPGMSWDNWGKLWHVDHIIPCASFDLSDTEQQKACFHYTNLQPLWWRDNIKKRDRLDWSPAGR